MEGYRRRWERAKDGQGRTRSSVSGKEGIVQSMFARKETKAYHRPTVALRQMSPALWY